MSEDGIHGSPAAREKFVRDHPNYDNPHPGNGRSVSAHPKRPAAKQVAAATTQVNNHTKTLCYVKDLMIFCEHEEKGLRKAAPEEEPGPKSKPKPEEKPKPGQKPKPEEKVLVLNVVPHGHANLNPLAGNRQGSGLTTLGQPLTDHAQDKYYEQGHDKLEHQLGTLKKSQQHAKDARANQDHRILGSLRADMAEGKAHRQGAAYGSDKAKFMKTYGDHIHGNAELYLSQGNPRVDDKITFKAQMIKHCSKHPIWKVWDCLTNRWIPPLKDKQELELVGLELPMQAFPPPVIPASYLQSHSMLPSWVPGEKAYWLKGIEPRRYKVHFLTCDPDYADRVIHLNVYPLIESGLQISISKETGKAPPKPGSWAASIHKYQEEFQKALQTLDHIVPGGTLTCEILPEASLTLANQWKEEEGSNEVIWSASVKAGVTLFDISVEKNIIDALPGWISEFIHKVTDYGIILKAGATAELEGAAEWKQAPEAAEAKVSGAVALKGSPYASVTLVAMLRGANEDAFGARANGLTQASVKGELGFEPEGGHMHLPFEVTVQWEKPLDISFLLVYVWGRRSYTHSFLKDYLHPLKVCKADLMGKG